MIEVSMSSNPGSKFSRLISFSILLFIASLPSIAQSNECNKLGAWLWRIEQTGFTTYDKLADSLNHIGVKRVYIKVADGRLDTIAWPTIVNRNIIASFHNRDMEVYAWSYNYPGNNKAQAEALTTAISTGYDGYVIDIEMEFDGETDILEDLVSAFYDSKMEAITEGFIDNTFTLGVTTWGNPSDHNFRIDIMDPYVDAYFPQTYIEVWGESYLENPAFWVEVGNREYRELGATKPIHHIISTEYNIIEAEQLNAFIQYAGPETSIWRIPGGATTFAIWQDWVLVDWDHDFCELTNTDQLIVQEVVVYPNPASKKLYLKSNNNESSIQWQVVDIFGHIVLSGENQLQLTWINIESLNPGFYNIIVSQGVSTINQRFIKQ